MKSHYRAVVIGGGVVGASVLYHLAKFGWTDVSRFAALGVPAEHITVTSAVTDHGTVFFSDRSERPCGRFAVVARRAP